MDRTAVRESTHRWSALSRHHAMLGEQIPLLETAIGRAYLTAADEDERELMPELLRCRGDRLGGLARDTASVPHLIAHMLDQRCDINETEWLLEADFAAAAVPVHAGQRLADVIGRGSRAWIES